MTHRLRVHNDAETFSRADLTVIGAANYINDPSTGVHVWGYIVAGAEPEQFAVRQIFFHTNGQISKRTTPDHVAELMRLAADPTVEFAAHNAPFEIRLWNKFMLPLGFAPVAIDRWVCTMAKAYAHAIPGALRDAAIVMQLRNRKGDASDMEMLSAYKPNRRPWEYKDDPPKFQRMYQYNAEDIYCEMELDESLDDLSPYERVLWQVDWQINDHGVRFDMPLVRKAVEYIEDEKMSGTAGFCSYVGNFRPTQRAKFKEWLAERGHIVKDTKKPTIEGVIRDSSDINVIEACQFFIGANKSSLAKYPAILRRVDDAGIARETKQYSGAHTRRWGGRGIQLDNLLCPAFSIPHLVVNLREARSLQEFSFLYGFETTKALSSMIRGTIIPRNGCRLVVGDYAQMEQRILAWLAGQLDALQSAERGEDPYCLQAGAVYNRVITKKDKEERQVGKINVLAFGYQGGIGACNRFAVDANVNLESLYWTLYVPTSTADERDKAEFSYILHVKRIDAHNAEVEKDGKGKWIDPGTKIGCLASDLLKQRWRKANSNIVQYWNDAEDAACNAVQNPGQVFSIGPDKNVSFFMHKQFLVCKLPSGGHICYPYPRLETSKKPRNGKFTRKLTYMFQNAEYGNKWMRTSTYGGKLTENIVQAAQRDLLADAMIRLHRMSYQIILHVHDEIVCELPHGFGTLVEFTEAMEKRAKWCADLPVNVESFETERYEKR